jgi:hypothetical protein
MNTSLPPAPTGLTITTGNGALTISWDSATDPTGGEVFAYNVVVSGGTTYIDGYTEAGLRNITIGGLTNGTTYNISISSKSHNGYVSGGSASGSGIPAGATLPTVFSDCWGTGLPTNCGLSPSQPPITVGSSFTIKVDIANTGPSGKVRAVIKDGSTVITGGDQNTTNLGTYPGGGLWSPYVTYTMPSRDIQLVMEAWGWNGTNWILNDTKTSTISSVQNCVTIGLTPYSQNINTGQSVNFTATTTPSTKQFTVNFRLRGGALLASRTTTGGTATYTYTPSAAGTYYVYADVGSPAQCTSAESTIQVSVPIVQHTISITVLDSVTSSPVSGANITIGTQTLSTNASGQATFTVNEGSITVTITKTGYNTYSTTELVYSNINRTYAFVAVTPTTGSLRFITIPTASDIYFGTTLKGTTDSSTGTLSIGSLTAGPVSYTVKKTGYNNATGTVTVVGGTTTDVPISLTPATPTTGDVCLKSTPAGASISIDGSLRSGKTTALSTGGCTSSNTVTGLTQGNHSYTLTLTGYQNKTGNFIITAGEVNNVNAGALTIVSTVGNLTISSNPVGARIYIDGADSGYATGSPYTTIGNITKGDHTYKLVLTGYKDSSGTFSIVAGVTTTISTITLVQSAGTLKFYSIPSGATISIGGISKGATTISGLVVPSLPTGLTNYTAVLTGYDIYNGTETVIEDVTTSVTINLVPTTSGKGSLFIETTPPGAEIFIDGTDKMLTTPHTFTEMNVGGHVYELTLSGYDSIYEIFSITAETTTTVNKTLQPVGGGEAGGSVMLFGIIGVAALGMMMTSKKP